MPEYFEMSFLTEKNKYVKNSVIKNLYTHFSLRKGKNECINHKYTLLTNKDILFNVYEDENTNFYEFYISIPDFIFHENTFKEELQLFTQFIEDFFKNCSEISIAFCGYEINSYLVSQLKDIRELTPAFLSQFPLVYIRNQGGAIDIQLNLKAQDIFVDPDKVNRPTA